MGSLLRSMFKPAGRPAVTPQTDMLQDAAMEAKWQANASSAAKVKGIESADKQIFMLKDRLLPYDPHIVRVPSTQPFNGGKDWEHENTPFEDYEVKHLQYLTLVGDTDRDTAKHWPAAEWHDWIEAKSPASLAARSHTGTPNAAAAREAKIPKTKISIADYKNMKKSGGKPSPNPAGTSRPAHSRNTSAISGGESLSRDPSFEGGAPAVRQNGGPVLANSVNQARGNTKAHEKPAGQASAQSNAKTHTPATNGHTHRTPDASRVKESNSRSQSNTHSRQASEHIKHGLPPRPQSPPRSNPTYNLPDPRPQKRPLDSADATQPEKRPKIDHSRTSSGSQTSLPRKSNTPSEQRPSPLKSQTQTQSSSQNHASPLPRKPLSKSGSKYEKPPDLPPLLSPLPPELGSGSNSGFAAKKPEGKKSSQNTPSKYGVSADTIVVKKSAASPLIDSQSTMPRSSRAGSEPFSLPALLSPTLPDVIEQELLRLQQKSAAAALSQEARLTVEARHEKARRPDTPGVARKTTVPKVGHPPKKIHAESSKSQEPPSRIVKLKYKKRRVKDIERILNMRPKPASEVQEKIRATTSQKTTSRRDEEDESEEDEPLQKTSKPSAPTAKKAPAESSTARSEPATKRPKAPEIDVAKSKTSLEPAFRSPGLSAPSQKDLLSTPKKGDSMKSAAMRKVNSSDGHAHTPQTSTPQPQSTEKPRTNGVSQTKPNPLAQHATTLKRKMDSILHLKAPGGIASVDEAARKLGLSVALECVAVYMVAFATSDRKNNRKNTVDWESVIGLWEFINGLTKGTPLQSLGFELGALAREELGRAYNERLSEKLDPELLKASLVNAAKRDRTWHAAHHVPDKERGASSGGGMKGLEVEGAMGPWTSMWEAREYAFAVLAKFAEREKTGWRPSEPGQGV